MNRELLIIHESEMPPLLTAFTEKIAEESGASFIDIDGINTIAKKDKYCENSTGKFAFVDTEDSKEKASLVVDDTLSTAELILGFEECKVYTNEEAAEKYHTFLAENSILSLPPNYGNFKIRKQRIVRGKFKKIIKIYKLGPGFYALFKSERQN